MRKFCLIFPLILTSCASTPVVVRSIQHHVVVPEEGMYNCPIVEKLPPSKTLTDIQVARLIVQLYQNNKTCKNSIDAIKNFLEKAKATTNHPEDTSNRSP